MPKDVEVPSTQTDHWQDSVMIWGAIGFDGKFVLEIVDETMGSKTYLDILQRRLPHNFPNLHLGKAEARGVDSLIYQQDGARAHFFFFFHLFRKNIFINLYFFISNFSKINL